MFKHLFFLIFIPILVLSQCVSNSSKTSMCNGQLKSNNSNIQTILEKTTSTNVFITNYRLPIFKLDQYSSTLRLLNASFNQFGTILITPRQRLTSNLRQLILQSNGIEQFNVDTVVLPQSLEKLSLKDNRLKILDSRLFSHLNRLKEIDLRSNQLKRISPQLLLGRNILLGNNPLDCRCTSDVYRSICEKSTTQQRTSFESNNCIAPYYDPHLRDAPLSSYLRFSTFTLNCPISAQPPPIIVWSTPFGNLTSINSTNIDLLASNSYDEPLYVTLTALAGPLSARTEHTLHASAFNQLSVTKARAALQRRISCIGINMLGSYIHEFDFDVETNVRYRAIWQIIFTAAFGLFLSLVAGTLCIILKCTYYKGDHLKTPPIYPTMAPNSASRTPPNFELNQWLSLAAANISGTLEQVRDKLRLGVQQVSEHMGQTMGRATELFTYGVQHAGGTIRQAAETSAAYLHSFRETSTQRLNTMRVQTLSSLRNPGHLMRAGMNILTTQVNSLRDYCGVITGHPMPGNYLFAQQYQQQEQTFHDSRYSPAPISQFYPRKIPTITEDDEAIIESAALIRPLDQTPYAGFTGSTVLANASGIGKLETADNSALSALNNFNPIPEDRMRDIETSITSGHMSAGIGIFQGHNRDYDENNDDDLVSEPERLTMYGGRRPTC